MLCDTAFEALGALLRRRYDEPLRRLLSELIGEVLSGINFDGSTEEIGAETRLAARKCISILQIAMEKRAPRCATPDNSDQDEDDPPCEMPAEEVKDIEYWLPPHLAHLLRRLEYDTPTLAPPQTEYRDFASLFETAIIWRIDTILVFFQRNNSTVTREIPPFFLASEEFAEKFRNVVRGFIFPQIRDSRQGKLLSTTLDLSKVNSENFWDHVTQDARDKVMLVWQQAWDDLKLIEAKKDDGAKVSKIKYCTKDMRDMLAPSSPESYDIPRIGNPEIDVFISLLDTSLDWGLLLNERWGMLHDIYEQEMDPRVFQQQAREGAFRDALLSVFNDIPEQWCDFLALLCHRVFPRADTKFLKAFAVNFGLTDLERRQRAPYLLRYLDQVRQRPEISAREEREESEREIQIKKLRSYLKGYDK